MPVFARRHPVCSINDPMILPIDLPACVANGVKSDIHGPWRTTTGQSLTATMTIDGETSDSNDDNWRSYLTQPIYLPARVRSWHWTHLRWWIIWMMLDQLSLSLV